MITTFLITSVLLFSTMFIVALGIKHKEESKIECELSKYCEIEKQRNCNNSDNKKVIIKNGLLEIIDKNKDLL